jgi:glycosyltransferase involved in cell wall biosynthesis
MKNDIHVAFLVDGSFLPIRNGTDYSISTLMGSLSKVDNIKPTLLLSWRGWDDPSIYHNQFFRTIFLPIKNFYNDNLVLEYTMSTLDVDIIHIYNAEEVVNLAHRFHGAGVKVIYEAVNIDHVLNKRLNAGNGIISASKSMQIRAMKLADNVLCRSETDRSHIVDMGISTNKIAVYRGAINVSAIPFMERYNPGKKIVFMGHMYYPPNENALKYIANDILPALKMIDKEYTVTIIGITPKAIIEEYSDTDIVFANGVDDIGKELSQYDIAISPLFEGSGTRLKLLDFMASGIPTISTNLGIEGLHDDIVNCLLLEDIPVNYARKIHELLLDRSLYQKLSIKGRSYVETYYDWDNNLSPFLDIYNS